MLIFLITCSFSLILFYNSLSLKPLPSWTSEMRFLFLWFWKYFSFFPIIKSTLLGVNFSSRMSLKKNKVESLEMSVLDLPDLVLECILEKLPPDGLCRMANVCTCMRYKCLNDHLWEKHMKNKWGRVIGPAAYREWQCHISSSKASIFFSQGYYLIDLLWPRALIRSSLGKIFNKTNFNFPPVDSIVSCYLALESGKFWFPAQVYNREVGGIVSLATWKHVKEMPIIAYVLIVTLVVEFNQYTHDSRWRRTLVSRKDHKEKGNEVGGFYGGIRKLCGDEEISMWRKQVEISMWRLAG